MSLIGHEVGTDYGNGHVESIHWIGKPWRRIELLVNDFWWKGERTERTWDLTFHLGFRRLGFFLHWTIARSRGYDYSEERP